VCLEALGFSERQARPAVNAAAAADTPHAGTRHHDAQHHHTDTRQRLAGTTLTSLLRHV